MQDFSDAAKRQRDHYLANFDSKAYQKLFYQNLTEEKIIVIKSYFEAFQKCKKGSVKKLLDFGSAATPVYVGVALAADLSIKADMSDFHPQNRELLRNWIFEKGDRLDFEQSFEFIFKLSDRSSEKIQMETRKAISQLKSYDLLKDFSEDNESYDIVISNFCIEDAATSIEEYGVFFKKVADLLVPGGTLMMAGTLNGTGCKIGHHFFAVFGVTQDLLLETIKANNLDLVRFSIDRGVQLNEETSLPHTNMFFFVAEKKFQ